jgi:hypothetical protein
VIRRFPETAVLDYREKDRKLVNFIALELHGDLRRLVWRFATNLNGSRSFGTVHCRKSKTQIVFSALARRYIHLYRERVAEFGDQPNAKEREYFARNVA